MQQNSKPIPAPIFNHRKRPRQAVITDPQVSNNSTSGSQMFGSDRSLGPSGAAEYVSLMPVGGFNTYQQQRPLSGSGAANMMPTSGKTIVKANPSPMSKTHTFHEKCVDKNSQKVNLQPMSNMYPNRYQSTSSDSTSKTSHQPAPQTSNIIRYQANVYGNELSKGSSGGNPSTVGNNTWKYQAPLLPAQIRPSWNNNSNPTSSTSAHTTTVQKATSYVDNNGTRNRTISRQQPNVSNYKPTGQTNNVQNRSQGQDGFSQARPGGSEMNTVEFDDWSSLQTNIATPVNKAPSAEKPTPNTKTAISVLKTSLHLITANIDGVRTWSKFKDTIAIMFEVFGIMDSAISRAGVDSKEFLIRDDKKNTISCVFYEIDRQLPKITRGLWYRVLGTYDQKNDKFKTLSVRLMTENDRMVVAKLCDQSYQTMVKLTYSLKEQ